MKVVNTHEFVDYFAESQDVVMLNNFISSAIMFTADVMSTAMDDSALNRFMKVAGKFGHGCGVDFKGDELVIAAFMISMLQSVSPSAVDMMPKDVFCRIAHRGKVFRKGGFDGNPYLKNIRFSNQTLGHFELSHNSYAKNELIMYDAPFVGSDGIMLPNLAVFDHKFKFPNIKENGRTWMSVTPNEIFSMKKPIEDASGNVLVLGCGLGYYAYMVCEKKEVSHVTIVEREPEVIELFSNYILPQFAGRDRITVVQADAVDYMRTVEDGLFDFCFADIWEDNEDVVPYLKVRKACRRFEKMRFSYWIEDALNRSVRQIVFFLAFDEFHKQHGTEPFELPEMLPEERAGFDHIAGLLENAEISCPEDIERCVKDIVGE